MRLGSLLLLAPFVLFLGCASAQEIEGFDGGLNTGPDESGGASGETGGSSSTGGTSSTGGKSSGGTPSSGGKSSGGTSSGGTSSGGAGSGGALPGSGGALPGSGGGGGACVPTSCPVSGCFTGCNACCTTGAAAKCGCSCFGLQCA